MNQHLRMQGVATTEVANTFGSSLGPASTPEDPRLQLSKSSVLAIFTNFVNFQIELLSFYTKKNFVLLPKFISLETSRTNFMTRLVPGGIS